jgi:hypothetical protein
MWRRRQPGGGVSWGELRPRRCGKWEETEGHVTLLVPRYGRNALSRWFERRTRTKPFKVHLDDVGTFVWQRCDGETRVAEIAVGLREEFGERIEPAEDRLVQFLTNLVQGRFVSVNTNRQETGS